MSFSKTIALLEQITAQQLVDVVRGVQEDMTRPEHANDPILSTADGRIMTVKQVMHYYPNWKTNRHIIENMIAAAAGRFLRQLCDSNGVNVMTLSPTKQMRLLTTTDGVERQAFTILTADLGVA